METSASKVMAPTPGVYIRNKIYQNVNVNFSQKKRLKNKKSARSRRAMERTSASTTGYGKPFAECYTRQTV